ncbi:hypothetical protein I3F60_06890 [Streptomyces sp. MUM 136J]|uniref:hypothetical protein n=1 Tax=Streptomyces sp. MUM 136J TaxID=2791992 RepID=UPI001F04A824|nr:hypothetical protein [Streptomyces sp. MUM 136J]MCH0568992.1 hypothetical protein [Streptomyces sp. MUM 136J]
MTDVVGTASAPHSRNPLLSRVPGARRAPAILLAAVLSVLTAVTLLCMSAPAAEHSSGMTSGHAPVTVPAGDAAERAVALSAPAAHVCGRCPDESGQRCAPPQDRVVPGKAPDPWPCVTARPGDVAVPGTAPPSLLARARKRPAPRAPDLHLLQLLRV